MFIRYAVLGMICAVGLSSPVEARAQKQQCSIAIAPQPVVVGAAWTALVSGLVPGQGSIVLGNGYNDGNFMLGEFFTADANGNIGVSPPLFEFQMINGQMLDPTGEHDFQVLHVNCNGHGVCTKSQALCDLPYTVVAQ